MSPRLYPWLYAGFFLLLSLPRLNRSLWLDEIMSVDFADGSLSELLDLLSRDVHPPLFYLLEWMSIRVFGLSEVAARMPAVLCGAATIVVLWHLACSVANAKAAHLACGLCATSACFLTYSREVHPYSLAALLATVCWLALVRLRGGQGLRWAIIGGAALGLMAHTFYLSALMVPAFVAHAMAHRGDRRFRINCGIALAVAAAVATPAILLFLHQTTHSISANHYRSELFFPHGWSWLYFMRLPGHLLLGDAFADAWPAALVLLGGATAIVWRQPDPLQRIGPLAVVLPWLALGLICFFKPIAVPRYLSWTFPFAALTIACVLAGMATRVRIYAFLILLVLQLLSWTATLGTLPREDWKMVAHVLAESMGDSDVVVVDNETARSCLVQYIHWIGRPDLGDNVFPWPTFRDVTEGRFTGEDRSLWLLERRPNHPKGEVINRLNTLRGTQPIGRQWTLSRFVATPQQLPVAP